MNTLHPFTVYNASAGAGKTYTLVKAYLITLLQLPYKESYKNILAITFTNKAVTEMKSRVLESLLGISNKETVPEYRELLADLSIETGIEEETIQKKAAKILKNILHNYAGFDIVTIDTFTHRVIRTFAKDLGIPMNFEIEMDTQSLIEESVDAVIAQVGTDPQLTDIIIEFALSKLEDDKSWDITLELNEIAKLLFNENDRIHLDVLSEKSAEDFKNLKNTLQSNIKKFKVQVIAMANEFFKTLNDHTIKESDFKGKYLPKHFSKLRSGVITISFNSAKWMQDITSTDFYNKTTPQDKKELIDSIRPTIESYFLITKKLLLQLKLEKSILKNLIPLSVLNMIHKELQNIKKEKSVLLISEFNKIISKAIRDQPAPFIYERLGERYRDYFIDEFQDTSELQWKNMIPLIDNALSTETTTGIRGHLTIVGDAKQAIYRWRGGKAEQFMELSSDHNPFSIQEKQVLNLPTNYRSQEEIIKFTNDIFTFLSKDFSNDIHRSLYETGNQQKPTAKSGGYVQISFIEAKNKKEEEDIYPIRTYDAILELQKKGYVLSDICILTRKQKEGTVIADYLTEQGVSIISSETLLLKNDPRVCFIIDMFTWSVNPEDFDAKIKFLYFLAEKLSVSEKHTFITKILVSDSDTFLIELSSFGINFNLDNIRNKPFYEAVEYCIRVFNLAENSPAYLQFFLDAIFSYDQKNTDGVTGFLSYWDQNKDKMSIVAPEGEDAVKMMTIHKSKGLEFPCVIYPFGNIDIYQEIDPKTWFPVSPEDYNGFEEVLINYNKELSDYGEAGQHIVAQRQSQLELDAFNILYVALTRAEEQLYIISKLDMNTKGEITATKFSGKFINYLKSLNLWDPATLQYHFGNTNLQQNISTDNNNNTKGIPLTSFGNPDQQLNMQIITNSGKLWNTNQQAALEKGNLIHDLMATIHHLGDVEVVLTKSCEEGKISFYEKEFLFIELLKVVSHPELKEYFSKKNKAINERDIISNGKIYRPDRIVMIPNGKTMLMDYKTGSFRKTDAAQIMEYAMVLIRLGHKVQDKVLVYFGENIKLEYV